MRPTAQVDAVRAAAEKHLVDEIHRDVPEAWIDHDKTKIGYEIPFTRQFYVYTPPRPTTTFGHARQLGSVLGRHLAGHL